MQAFLRFSTAAAFCLAAAQPVWSEGLTLRFEGGAALTRGADVGIFSVVRDAPETAFSQLDFEGGMPRGPFSLSYRAEATWAFDLGDGTRMRIGGILSGLDGSSAEVSPVHAFVYARPAGPDQPEGEIGICSFPSPCRQFVGDLDRSYHEILPELMFGRDGGGGAMHWFGLQGFAGTLNERAFSSIEPLSGPGLVRTTVTELSAKSRGVMLAWQHERPLASGMTLLLGAGLGTYRIDADGLALVPDNPGRATPSSGSFDGVRAQFMVGLEKPLSDRLTLGATLRADHWTDQPRVTLDWIQGDCNPTVCEPPGREGNFDLSADPFSAVSLGLTLTLRL